MPLIVAVRRDGSMNVDAGALAHGGKDYPGPVFDVPPDVAVLLCSRPGFREATAEEAGDSQVVAPVKRAPGRPRKTA